MFTKKLFNLLCVTLLTTAFTACDDDNEDTPVSKELISIVCNGQEVVNGSTIKYEATENPFGDIVAGHDTEPTFTSPQACQLEVTVTLPENQLEQLQWCGITHTCDIFKESGSYTRSCENATQENMEMHAQFRPGTPSTCKVKVDVKVNSQAERSFFIEYNYTGQ